jgi:hypothetical protein
MAHGAGGRKKWCGAMQCGALCCTYTIYTINICTSNICRWYTHAYIVKHERNSRFLKMTLDAKDTHTDIRAASHVYAHYVPVHGAL